MYHNLFGNFEILFASGKVAGNLSSLNSLDRQYLRCEIPLGQLFLLYLRDYISNPERILLTDLLFGRQRKMAIRLRRRSQPRASLHGRLQPLPYRRRPLNRARRRLLRPQRKRWAFAHWLSQPTSRIWQSCRVRYLFFDQLRLSMKHHAQASIIAPGWESVNLSKFTHYLPKFGYSYREGEVGLYWSWNDFGLYPLVGTSIFIP